MKKIKLTQNKYALVDNEDFEWLNSFKWCIVGYKNYYYAGRDDKGKKVKMHRLIVNPIGKQVVDHINGNTLDNRKKNLRLCFNYENIKNRRLNRNNVSGYKGIIWTPHMNKWKTRISNEGKSIHVGYFDTKKEAAIAYNAAAVVLHKKFAKLNEITN